MYVKFVYTGDFFFFLAESPREISPEAYGDFSGISLRKCGNSGLGHVSPYGNPRCGRRHVLFIHWRHSVGYYSVLLKYSHPGCPEGSHSSSIFHMCAFSTPESPPPPSTPSPTDPWNWILCPYRVLGALFMFYLHDVSDSITFDLKLFKSYELMYVIFVCFVYFCNTNTP